MICTERCCEGVAPPHPGPMGTASGCGTTREGCDGGGDRPYVERVCSRRGPHPYPTMGTASGCGTTVGGFRLGGRKDGCHLVLPVKTGIHGGVTAVGTAPYVERVCSRRGPHPYPTMGTASGCGTTREGWGQTYNPADIPYFAPAKNTRLLQLADFVANAIYGRYEGGYTKQFDRIAPRIDQEQGRMYGLVHLARNRQDCYCPACVSRRVAS